LIRYKKIGAFPPLFFRKKDFNLFEPLPWLVKLLLLKIYNVERVISILGEGYSENVLNP